MKLHLPGVLRNALLALMSSVTVFSANAYDTLVCEDRNFIAEEYILSIHHQGNLIFRNNESYKIISMIEGCHVDFASSIVISGNTCRPSNPTGYTKGAIVDHSFYLNDCNSVQITDNTVIFDSLGDSGGIVAAISQFTDVDILFENNEVGSNAQMVGGVFLPEYSITSYMGEKEEVFSFFTDSELVLRNNHVKALLSEDISGLPCYYAIIGGVMHAEKLKVTNSTILIENNTVDSGDASLLGGCVFGEFLAQDDKCVIEFRNNTVKGGTISGGIFYAAPSPYEYEHALEGFARVTFENNKAISESDVVYGGAMSNQSDFMLIQNNGELRFIGNSAQSKDLKDVFGGALFCASNGDSSIIWKNDYVLFRGNYVTDGKTYRLNSISSLSAAVILAADEGKRIEIFDPITMSNSLYIGYDITDKYDFTSCTGTILLSGIHAQEDLAKINPKYSAEDLLYSRVNEVYSLIAEYGNVILEDTVVLCTRPSPSYVTAYGGPNAYFTMRNSTLAAYRQTFYNLTMEGANILEAQYGTQIVHLTLNVTDVNKDTAVVSTEGKGIIFAQDDASGLYPVLNITYDKAKLLKGVYKLITLSPESDVYNIGSVTINGTKSTSIAYEGAGDDLYLLNEGNDIYTLVFDYSYGPGEVEQRDAATLTWNAASGTWGAGSGSANSCWSGNVEDLNYYDGDSVVFASAATVQLSGSLAPASVAVRNTSGKVEWNGTGQLAGATAVTKTGAGTLSINTANAYTGGTSVQGGTLVVGNAQALGSGAVALQGGTLNLGGYAVNNNVTVTNNTTLSGASRYTGTLDLQAGRLSVEGAVFQYPGRRKPGGTEGNAKPLR